MKPFHIFMLLLFCSSFAFAEMDYMECATNCETMTGIWACEYSYCALYDMTAYDALTTQQQCAFDCIWEYRWCKSGVYSSGSNYYETPGTAFRAEKEATCDKIYMDCMAANEIQAEYSPLDDYCREKETTCYTALKDKYCKPVQTACAAKCGEVKPPDQPVDKTLCYGTTTYTQYCTSYCKAKLGPTCGFVGYVIDKDPIIANCMCYCPDGTSESYNNIDCRNPLPAGQQPAEDKCKNVNCPDKCENGIMYTIGSCNSDNGECTYKEEQCPQGCEDSTKCKAVKMQGQAFYYDSKGTKVPLKYVKIETIAVKDSHIYAYGHLVTDAEGKFTWDDPAAFQPGYHIDVDIVFDESKGRLYVVESDPNFPLDYVYEEDVSVSDSRLSNYEMDLTSHKVQKISDAAKVYVTAQKAIDYKENVLKITPTVKERVLVYNSGGNSHWYESEASFGDNRGLHLLPISSQFTTSYIEDTIYHEYCHHIQDEMYKAPQPFSGADHGGYYYNSNSGWGLLEGWAEYCAWEMKNYYKDNPDYDLYRIRGVAFDLELNYQMREKVFRVTNKYSTPNTMEEMAIASLIVDLRDSPQSRGLDDDMIVIPTSTLWDAYSQSRDFNDGKGVRHVITLRDLYIALNASGYKPLLEYYDKDTKLTQLDKVFLMHGAYQDLNSNGKWDPGEPFGYSGNGTAASAYRTDLEALNGSDVTLTLKDSSGNPLSEGVMVHVDVKFSGDNSYLSYSYDVPVGEGVMNVPYPPREYDATITMYAFQPNTNNRASNSFTITTQEFYDQVDGSKPIGTYVATVPVSKSISCQADYQCVYNGEGLSCLNGACSPVAKGPTTGTGTTTAACTKDSDCSYGSTCIGGSCAQKGDNVSPSLCLIIPALAGLAVFAKAMIGRKR
jgi:hypothetical protein